MREEEIVPLANAYVSSVKDHKHELHQVGRVLDRLKLNGEKKEKKKKKCYTDGVCSFSGNI